MQRSRERAFRAGQPWLAEFRVTWQDGSVHWLALRTQSVRKSPSRLLGVVADISERHRLHAMECIRKDLEAANAELRSNGVRREQFVAMVSHELRTPLNAVVGLSQLMLMDNRTPLVCPHRQYTEHILKAGHDLLQIVNDLLDLAKVDACQLTLEHESIKTADFCSGVLCLMRPEADRRQVALRLDPAGAPETVEVDPLRLRQMLYNLLSNALKFSPPNGVVSLRAVCDAHLVRFEVEDQGIGIAPEDQVQLFQPFAQLAAGRAHGRASTGIGLAITRRLAELHGGKADVVSELGKGSRFFVELPLTATAGAVRVRANPFGDS